MGRVVDIHDDRQPVVFGQTFQKIEHDELVAKIESGFWLIEDHDLRPTGQRAGDEHHLKLDHHSSGPTAYALGEKCRFQPSHHRQSPGL